MHIYLIGINGAGMSALAHFALDAAYRVSGSDIAEGVNTKHLAERGAHCFVGDQQQNLQQAHAAKGIDFVVVSAAIPSDSPELTHARQLGLNIIGRGDLITLLLEQLHLQLIAVSGTHGKTTTSAMIAWAMKTIGQPVSHIVGTNLSFANSGAYVKGSTYMVIEADEYDRMMLAFHPEITLITSLDYDHPDIYPTKDDYFEAFRMLVTQSNTSWAWLKDVEKIQPPKSAHCFALEQPQLTRGDLNLAGAHNRANAELVITALSQELALQTEQLHDALNTFPGTARRFERIAAHTYSDYAHTPVELQATLQLAREVANQGQNIVAVYQPHQNIRQHLVKADYADAFAKADTVYWLPTYLSREDPELPVFSPEELIQTLRNPEVAHPATMDDDLAQVVKDHQTKGDLVIFFGAGSIDEWAREICAAPDVSS